MIKIDRLNPSDWTIDFGDEEVTIRLPAPRANPLAKELAVMERRALDAERAAMDAGKANADAIRAALMDAASRVEVFGRQYGINAQDSNYEHFAVKCAALVRELAK